MAWTEDLAEQTQDRANLLEQRLRSWQVKLFIFVVLMFLKLE